VRIRSELTCGVGALASAGPALGNVQYDGASMLSVFPSTMILRLRRTP
jgi:hypothetical protein